MENTTCWYDDYLLTNNGDGTLTALHKHFEALDLNNVEYLLCAGIQVRPEGEDGFSFWMEWEGQLRRSGVLTIGAGLTEIERQEFNNNRALA